MNTQKDIELIERVKLIFNHKTDVEVAKTIGTMKQNISQVRSGKRGLSMKERLICYDKLGFSWAREAIFHLF